MADIPPSVQARLDELPDGLREHVERVRQIGRELAQIHAVDADRVDCAIAAHDLARALSGEALLEEARRLSLPVGAVERRSPVLLHGPVAALWLEREHGLTDKEVLEAVRWHTTGHKGMGPIAKVVFVADKLDPTKDGRFQYVDRVRALVQESLDRAILEFLSLQFQYFLREGYLITTDGMELRNELVMRLSGVHA